MFSNIREFDDFKSMMKYEIKETEKWLEKLKEAAKCQIQEDDLTIMEAEENKINGVYRAKARVETLKEVLKEYKKMENRQI